jgi:hypothetical protein
MPRVLFLIALCLPSALPAASLYKCVAPGGAPAFQSQPCPAGHATAWVRELPASPPLPPSPPSAAAPARAAAPVRSNQRAARAPRRDPVAVRCEAARRRAAEQRDRLWNRLSFRQRSQLDADVARACAR